jgi:6-methylsalicylate decarboxylase
MLRGVRAAGDRRSFISGIAAAGLGALSCSSVGRFVSAFAQTPVVAKTSLIDVHHHFVPPFYLSENRDRIVAAGGGRINPAYLSWTPEQSLAAMEKHGVATSVLSLSASAFWFGDRQAAVRTARQVNEYGADLVRSHKGRFGLFAIIHLPDTEASLREIEYAYSVLRAGWDWVGDQLR